MTSDLLPIAHRPNELGRIRLGEKAPSGAPRRLTMFRLTSGSHKLLEAAKAIYGGKVSVWEDAPDEGYWQLHTEVSELDILIPTGMRTVSQSYETWQGGTCERRCDGTTESISGAPCLCAAAGTMGTDTGCEVVTRVNVMLPRLPGIGFWRLDTGGWFAATTLPATMSLLTALSAAAWVPAVLRAEQRSRKVREGDRTVVHRFVVPVLDLPGVTLGAAIDSMGGVEPLRLPEHRPAPTLREALAARSTSGSPTDLAPVGVPEASDPVTPTAGPEAPHAAGRAASADPTTPTAAQACGALPPADHPLAMTAPCGLSGEHRVHRSNEGSWPA